MRLNISLPRNNWRFNTIENLKNIFTLKYSILPVILFLGVQVYPITTLANSVQNSSKNEIDPATCPINLNAAINKIINHPEFKRSRWGILIQNLDSQEILYSLDSQKYFLPASNVKLLTTAAALLKLGAQFRIRTSVYGTGNIPNLATLRIVGKGDPSFTTKQLKDLVRQLKNQGVRQSLKVMVEDSYFKQTGINASWEWEDIFFSYGTSINSLNLNENAVTLTALPRLNEQPIKLEWSDSIAARQWQIENQTKTAPEETPNNVEVRGIFGRPILEIKGEMAVNAESDTWDLAIINPSQYFLESLLQILTTEGIEIEQGLVVKRSLTNSSEKELAFVESEPLAVLIQETNQESNNLYAESLLQILGSESDNLKGIEAVQQQLTKLGVDPDSYVLVDGSGLSRHNLVSPEAIAQTLRLMAKTPHAKVYRESLAVAGVNGTLESRFKNTLVEGNLQAKTGTLSGNVSLSGYLTLNGYQPLILSIMVNQSNRSVSELRDAIDEIVITLSHYQSCQLKT
ncbi:MAG: D-alanyl-D-alanine carboxypeptidase/D-alanyl-D-alanine-endopeptidase [Hydrococcus sp. RU_2_2]|nr:D-alanyl-D-alanine carboxypeptidase/D-alanyl-D-alanine-endopeptidase [Hydrococcus sp. RU_2_2]NJP18990.1 D-alanyl-D-alanine carboxypeptidase/D-alanyl-D-alanine-endopeptidase [Hydrococcus sp. CRU_1_1]